MSVKPTPEQIAKVKSRLQKQGKTIRQWSLDNGFPPAEVYKVMSGERKALYGKGHEIAVAIGLKPAA